MRDVLDGPRLHLYRVGWILAGLALILDAAASHAQSTIGPEFHVNEMAQGVLADQRVAFATGGEFLVIWEQFNFVGTRFWSQWFSPLGRPLGTNRPLPVTQLQAFGPLVAPGAHGGALVFWEELHNTTTVVGGELLPDGSWALSPRRIIFLDKVLARFASPLPQGGYALALLGSRPHRNERRTFLVLTDDDLNVVRGPSLVSPTRHTIQDVGGLAVSPDGDLMVTWTELGPTITVLSQLFSPAGRPLAKAFRVPENLLESQYDSVVAQTGNQGYVVVWEQDDFDTGATNLTMRLLKPDGTPRGDAFPLDPAHRFRVGQQVAADAAGNFLVAWQEEDPSNGSGDVWGRLYHPDGSPYGPKVRLNQYTANDQTNVQVAAGPNGTFVAVWQSTGQDNGDDGIYGRVFRVP